MRDDIFGCGVFTDDDIAALLVGLEHADHLIWDVCLCQEERDGVKHNTHIHSRAETSGEMKGEVNGSMTRCLAQICSSR